MLQSRDKLIQHSWRELKMANNYMRFHQRDCSLQPLMLMYHVKLGNEVALFHIWFFHTTPAAPPSHMYREGRLASQGWLEGVERVCGWGGGKAEVWPSLEESVDNLKLHNTQIVVEICWLHLHKRAIMKQKLSPFSLLSPLNILCYWLTVWYFL